MKYIDIHYIAYPVSHRMVDTGGAVITIKAQNIE